MNLFRSTWGHSFITQFCSLYYTPSLFRPLSHQISFSNARAFCSPPAYSVKNLMCGIWKCLNCKGWGPTYIYINIYIYICLSSYKDSISMGCIPNDLSRNTLSAENIYRTLASPILSLYAVRTPGDQARFRGCFPQASRTCTAEDCHQDN